MDTIKSYTDIEQSKILSKILPLESADYTRLGYGNDNVITTYYIESSSSNNELKRLIGKDNMYPCWSLAALISILPDEIKHDGIVNNLWITSEDVSYYSKEYDSYLYCEEVCIVDACVEMIIKLNELNYMN